MLPFREPWSSIRDLRAVVSPRPPRKPGSAPKASGAPPSEPRPAGKAGPSRLVAHQVLVRIAREGAYADRALDATLNRASLAPRDAALATELVYGTLREVRRLDHQLAALAKQPLAKLPAEALAALRLGAYQLLSLRVPDHGAVNESVALVRARHPHMGGFANAVLRELARRRDRGTLADPKQTVADPLEALAIETSHPTWLLRRVAAELGPAEAEAFALANNRVPPLGLRVNRLRAEPPALLAELAAAGVEATALACVPGALVAHHAGSPSRLSPFVDGRMTVQDPAAQLVGFFAAPRPGALVLDCCAAPGGKTTHQAELMGDQGRVVAVDVHPAKLRLVEQTAARLGLRSIETAAADATDVAALRAVLGPGATPELVVVDAPCSGVGTLRRNAEQRARPEENVAELTVLQDRLLDAAASLLQPGGVLVYVVCSVTIDEGPARVEALLARRPELRLGRSPAPWLAPWVVPLGEGEVLRTWPHRHDMDGFFAARFVRR